MTNPYRESASSSSRIFTVFLGVILLAACTVMGSQAPSTAGVQPEDGRGPAPAGPIGVVSAIESPAIHANEVQRGLVRTEEAVGFFGAGLGTGLAALAACAPALFLAPICGLLAASAGLGGAAIGGLAGDLAADAGDTKRISAHLKTGTELQEELRLAVVERLRMAGYDAIDIGNADGIGKSGQEMPAFVIETTVRRIYTLGAGREHFNVNLQSSFRVLQPHELSARNSSFDKGYAGSTIPTGGFEERTRTLDYVSPALPLGSDAEQTARAIQTGISAGIQDMAARIAAEDLERLRPRTDPR